MASPLLGQIQATKRQFARGWDLLRHKGPSQFQFWLIALLIGIAAGLAATVFRMAITVLQTSVYGTPSVASIHSYAEGLPWWMLLLIPTLGGLVVGLIVHFFTPEGRVRSVADVIEGAALNDGRVEKKAGLASAICSWITLSTGGSTGREGPVVHIAAMISSWVSNRIRADGGHGARPVGLRRGRLPFRPVSMRRSQARCSRWRWCCAISPCTPLPRSSSRARPDRHQPRDLWRCDRVQACPGPPRWPSTWNCRPSLCSAWSAGWLRWR